MPDMQKIRDGLKKQCQWGIWYYPEEHEEIILASIDTLSTPAAVEGWKYLMQLEYPENRSPWGRKFGDGRDPS